MFDVLSTQAARSLSLRPSGDTGQSKDGSTGAQLNTQKTLMHCTTLVGTPGCACAAFLLFLRPTINCVQERAWWALDVAFDGVAVDRLFGWVGWVGLLRALDQPAA